MISQKFLRSDNVYNNLKILGIIISLKTAFIICSNLAIRNNNLELINFFPSVLSLIIGIKIILSTKKVI